MSNKKTGDLGNISDILIVRKITEENLDNPNEVFDKDIYCDSVEENDRHLLAEEHEAIVRKQLQMLQADERGKRALIAEIAAIKQKQEKRAEAIKSRQHALEIEKERARRIASLPPPLPKSVKLLLQKSDEPIRPSKPVVQMPEELKTVAITPVFFDKDENKENIIDPEEMEAKKILQEEWNLKARKRFNEALKKDRQKEEYANIMKQIQNAEIQNRREMAKNISSEKSRNVPCPLSDKFQAAKKQIDMEDTAEKWFKKNTKEHVIEEIEGYQDYYETKYKRIDSECESKLIDCVPSFVKENYEYLLEDQSKFQGGKNFSGLDDSGSDLLNQAYIETPPHDDVGSKIDLVIDDLDKLRSKLQTEYDQTLKPLLVASMEVPPKVLSDKAVETDFFKQPCEDKAVQMDKLDESHLTPPSINSFKRPRTFAYKKRYEPFLPSFGEYTVPDMHCRDVHYPLPAVALSGGLGATSWSSSSYCSIPSKHGFPNVPGSTEYCDICSAERENKLIDSAQFSEQFRSISTLANGMRVDSSTNEDFKSSKNISPKKKIALSGYVQQLAKKYLEPKSDLSKGFREGKKTFGDVLASGPSTPEMVSPAFEIEKISRSDVDLSQITPHKSAPQVNPVSEVTHKSESMVQGSDKIVDTFSRLNADKNVHAVNNESEKNEVSQYAFSEKFDAYKTEEIKSYESTDGYSEYDKEFKRLQIIQKVLSRRDPLLNCYASPKPVNQGNSEQTGLANSFLVDGKKEMSCKPHVYHELSTIHEADSALTASSLQISQSKLSFEKSLEKVEQEKSEAESSKVKFEDSTENLKIISLLDPPDSKISELAKNIHFIAKSPEEAAKPFKVTKSFSSESSDAAILSKESLSSSHKSLSSSSPSFSNGKIYSSSLTENHAKYTHLKSTETLPKYFKDISSIQLKNISCPESSLKSSITLSSYSSPFSSSSPCIPSIIDTGIKSNSHEPSTNLPLVSGFIDNRKTTCASSSDSFQESSTNHPLVSGFISDMRKSGMSGSNSNHEFDSKHTLASGFISDMKAPDVKSPDSFHPMTPHSNISSPDVRKSSIAEFRECYNANNQIVNSKEQSSSPESGAFKPMTPHSNISSPSTVAQPKQQIYADSSTESFKPMTPRSMVSSPSLSSDESVFKGENPSLGSSKFIPMTFRLTIPVPLPISSVETGVQNPKIRRMPELRLGSKSEVHRHPDNMQLAKDSETGFKSPFFSDDEAKAYHDRKSAYQESREKVSSDARSKRFSRACSSDFFVPQISGADMTSPQTQSQEFDLVEGSLTKSSQKEEQLHSNSQSSKTSSSSSGRSNDKFSDLKFSSTGSIASCKTKMEEGTQGFTERRPANYGTKLDLLDLELPKVVKKQYGSLQAISSTSSSSENLSDMFSGSKIMYQSTPIKSMEELAQEKGILEEPDLTLMATQITCMPDELELPRDPSSNTTDRAAINVNLEKDITLLTSPSESKTPANQSLSPLGSCDTPSMRSFLRHEISCMQGENSSVKDENSASQASKAQNEVQKSQKFPRVGYKLRTKRLWNNLEEVRKRNLAEERKKISSVNRLKAKEYAKKLTPKRKEN